MMGHAERHHRLDPGAGIALDFTGQFRFGNAHHTRHAFDRHEVVDFFFDENRQHQVVQAEFGFLEQTAQARIAAQTAWTCFGELAGHG
ncbi:hypothetical protein D3C87_1192790 [compost metagenome]